MTAIKVDSKEGFYSSLERRLRKKKRLSAQALKFSRLFYAQITLAELSARSWEEILDTVLSSWQFFSEFDGTRAQVRVFSSSAQKSGATSPLGNQQSVIEVAAQNTPFLLDSIRLELSRRSLVLSEVQQCLLSGLRSGRKTLIVEDQEASETLIHLKIDEVGNPSEIEAAILRVLELVRQVNEGFAPMRQQLLLWRDGIGASAGQNSEEFQLLSWLHANNFTFLGYEEFTISGRTGKPQKVPSAALGLCKEGMAVNGESLVGLDQMGGGVYLSKLPIRSQVHRPAYYDAITLAKPKGKTGAQRIGRFVGLFTSSVYSHNPMEIPLIRKKVDSVFETSGFPSSSHKGREISHIIESLPRDELFHASSDELTETVLEIQALQERRVVRLLTRTSDNFVTCLVYLPKDAYDTEQRIKIQQLLSETYGAVQSEFTTFFSESALTRTYFVLQVSDGVQENAARSEIDTSALESRLAELTYSWEDILGGLLQVKHDTIEGARLFGQFGSHFPPGYQDYFSPADACSDIKFLSELSRDNPLVLDMYQAEIDGTSFVKFKLFHWENALPLSDVIPILENLGARTVAAYPYKLKIGVDRIWIHDFVLQFVQSPAVDLAKVKVIFQEAFQEIWRQGQENDSFNRLIPTATMHYREVIVIRAYSRYFGQIQSTYSQQYIAECLTKYSLITRLLFALFEIRFDPAGKRDVFLEQSDLVKQEILTLIDDVENLADDRILRKYIELIEATVRSNYYQRRDDGSYSDCLAFKFRPTKISEMPQPVPEFEIFVYSARVEGVHLRGGKVARGGLRWSDRSEDYRTEVLGLVKAQQVKNSVIVPVGAKGGFLTKQTPLNASRDQVMDEGKACYRMFIQGLLDLTDNLSKGKVIPPRDVVRHDGDDSYLVVAADKGTATFSDIANEISEANGFWLGDAFASGGSVGYDHKAMGITARGAWKSVQQHFRDWSVNIQTTDFTVVGIGDMSGDVFGNGMLLSEKVRLVAAFNHLHIFIDPEPDSAKSYPERKRLFNLDRSNWSDYNPALISKGGGVFSRKAKSIAVSKAMRTRFDLRESSVTPNQLIVAILKTEVDLLWNGGIGTYVKSKAESHLDVGDKATDAIRVNGVDLRCKVIGEGGNLGLTQLARVEFSLNGGACFTDFIDNAGGVNCSDAEVNIKILLNQVQEQGRLTEKARRKTLSQMTGQVAELVLDNNYMQARSINLMLSQAQKRSAEYLRIISMLENKGGLDRQLEFLPSDDELAERRAKNQYLTAPELSVLTSYVKSGLKAELATSELLDDPYLEKEMGVAFPAMLVKKYKVELGEHRLRRDLIATQISNGIVNHMGMSFVARMVESTGVNSAHVAKAYAGARDVFQLEQRWDEICEHDYLVSPELQKAMMLDLNRLIRRVTRWLLRNRRRALDLAVEVPVFSEALQLLFANWQTLLQGATLEKWRTDKEDLIEAGISDNLAGFGAAAHHLYAVMGIVEVANRTGESIVRVAEVYFALGERLQLHWFSRQMHEYQAGTHWQALARESLQDDLNWQQLAIAGAVLAEGDPNQCTSDLIDTWFVSHRLMVDRWMSLQTEMASTPNQDPAVFTVAIRELLDLAQSSDVVFHRF
jgi:glutamate dehydrogenase